MLNEASGCDGAINEPAESLLRRPCAPTSLSAEADGNSNLQAWWCLGDAMIMM